MKWQQLKQHWFKAPPLQQTIFLVAQTVKNSTAVRETWVRSLGWEHLLEKGIAIHSSLIAWRIPWTEEPVGYSPWDRKESGTPEAI